MAWGVLLLARFSGTPNRSDRDRCTRAPEPGGDCQGVRFLSQVRFRGAGKRGHGGSRSGHEGALGFPMLIVDRSLETSYLTAGLPSATEPGVDVSIRDRLTANDVGPGDFALISTAEIALLTDT